MMRLVYTVAAFFVCTKGKHLSLHHANFYVGHPAMLKCNMEISHIKNDTKLTWNKTSKGVTENLATISLKTGIKLNPKLKNHIMIDQSIPDTSVLFIKSVVPADAGCYQCHLRTKKKILKTNLCITVVQTIPGSITFSIDKSELHLTCQTSSTLGVPRIHWGHNVGGFPKSQSKTKINSTTIISNTAIVNPPSKLWGETVSCCVHTAHQEFELHYKLGNPAKFIITFLVILCAYTSSLFFCCCSMVIQALRVRVR